MEDGPPKFTLDPLPKTEEHKDSWVKDYIQYVHGYHEPNLRSRYATKEELEAIFSPPLFFTSRKRTRWEKFLAKVHLLNAWFFVRNRYARVRNRYSRWRRRVGKTR